MASVENYQQKIPNIRQRCLFNNSFRFRKDPLSLLSSCCQIDSPLIGIDDGFYVVVAPELIELVLHDKHQVFRKSLPDEDRSMVNFASSVMNSSGEDWRRKRKVLQPGFSRDDVAKGVDATIEITQGHLDRWQIEPPYSDIRKSLQRLCFDIGCQFFLKTTLGEKEQSAFVILSDLIIAKTRDGIRFPLGPFDRTEARLACARDSAKELAGAALARARQQRQGSDKSVAWHDGFERSFDEGSDEDDNWLRDEFCTMVLSGLEPMSAGLAWTLHLLTAHPDVLQRVTAEIDALATNGDGPISLDGLNENGLRETRAALKEALRLFPPAWLTGRTVFEDTVLGDFLLPKGSALMISPWVNHRSARYFDLPEDYRPDRWLDGTLEERLPRYAFFPFGGGSRRCIGEHFSMIHMTAILVCILRRFTLKRMPHTKVRPYPALVLRPLGVTLTLTPRASEAGLDRTFI
ncbi:cytochrome P450 [Agrobacterium vitis]|uniref:cytochrome P450 n=1 Tax=Agrobacterium vitis TaxID=373 RepID=UPI0008933A68|nr:cytochrome P450 [Agrobacterium vitis]MCE6077766.1 cytochrome P450 [Agrobacterium vitis]MCF1455088.1 cytochrome P450 [Agrobacterium vitis]MCF1469549.1 cytochrome P450 [Agrobacterium vitis]MUO73133.1 cytochrome P450 [Agrobacterium vitis]MUO86350.1 cytochrome P450 [Agrobacterium vitis]